MSTKHLWERTNWITERAKERSTLSASTTSNASATGEATAVEAAVSFVFTDASQILGTGWEADLSVHSLSHLADEVEEHSGGFGKAPRREPKVDPLWQTAVESQRTPANLRLVGDARRYQQADGAPDLLLPRPLNFDDDNHAHDEVDTIDTTLLPKRRRRRWTEGNVRVGKTLMPLTGVQGSGSDGRYVFLAPATDQRGMNGERVDPSHFERNDRQLLQQHTAASEVLHEDPLDLVEHLALALDQPQLEMESKGNSSHASEIEATDTGNDASSNCDGVNNSQIWSDECTIRRRALASELHESVTGPASGPASPKHHRPGVGVSTSPCTVPRRRREKTIGQSESLRQPRRTLVRAARAIAEYIHHQVVMSMDSEKAKSIGLSVPNPDIDELVSAGLIPLLEILLWNEGAVVLNDTDGLTAAVYGATALADLALYASYEPLVGSASVLECLRRVLTSHWCYRFAYSLSPLAQLLLRECWRCLRNISGNVVVAARMDFLSHEAERAREPSLIELALLMSRTFEAPPAIILEAWASLRNWCAAATALASGNSTAASGRISRQQSMEYNPSACAMLLEQTNLGQELWALATKCLAQIRACTSEEDFAVYRELLEQLWALIHVLLASVDALQRERLDLMGILDPIADVLRMPLQTFQEPAPLEDQPWEGAETTRALIPPSVRISCLRCLELLLEHESGLQCWLRYTRRPGGCARESIPLMVALVTHLTCTQMSESALHYAIACQAADVIVALCQFGPVHLDVLHTPGLVQGLVGQVAAQSLDLLAELAPTRTTLVAEAAAADVDSAAARLALDPFQPHSDGYFTTSKQLSMRLLALCLEALAHLAVHPEACSRILSIMDQYGGMRSVLDMDHQFASQPMIRSRLRRLLLSLRRQAVETRTKTTWGSLDLEETIRNLSHTAACLGGFGNTAEIALVLQKAQQTLCRTSLRRSASSDLLERTGFTTANE